jgi:predicted amidophosphoribosyltransferase
MSGLIGLLLPTSCLICSAPPDPCCLGCRPKPAARVFTRGEPGVGQLSGFSSAPYSEELSKLFSAFKDKSQLWLLRDLGDLAQAALEAAATSVQGEKIDFATYIGSSAANYRKRGYNPALVLLRRANRSCRLPIVSTLRPRGRVLDQAALTLSERAANLDGMLKPTRLAFEKPRRALLFDDVVTTGSTLSAATKALGAMNVEVAAIAVLADVELRREVHLNPGF